MKIGFDAKRVFHNFRGLGNYSRTLVEGLLEFYPDNEYHLYTPAFGDLRSLAWKKKHWASHIHTPENFLGKLAHPLWRSFGLASQVKQDGMDIYHGLSHEIPYGLASAKLKTVVTVHDLIFLRYPQFFPWVDRQTYFRKTRYAAESADCVVAVCEQTKRDLVDFMHIPEAKVKVVYQSCSPIFYDAPTEMNLDAAKAKYSLKTPFILSVGALEERKNYLTLLDAYAKIKDVVPHDLVIAGKGKWDYRKKLEAKLDQHQLRSRVKVIDGLSTEELASIYQLSDLFVYPSLFEGFGIPIIEALFCGVPVVTSVGSCFPESGGPSSKYVDPNNFEELAAEMLVVITNRTLHHQMSIDGRAYVERFHTKQTTQKMMDVYQSLT